MARASGWLLVCWAALWVGVTVGHAAMPTCPTALTMRRITGQAFILRLDHPETTPGIWCAYDPTTPVTSPTYPEVTLTARSLPGYHSLSAARAQMAALVRGCPAHGPLVYGPCGMASASGLGPGAFLRYAQSTSRSKKTAVNCDVYFPLASGGLGWVEAEADADYRGDKSYSRFCRWATALAALVRGR